MAENTIQSAGNTLDSAADRNVDTVDTDVRYMAYTSRLMTALRASSRYVAYTSDIGEAFRPVVPPSVVRACYGISWLYVSGDVAYETYKAKRRGPTPLEAGTYSENTRLTMIAVQRGVFQAVASMGLPAFTIHTVVRHAPKLFKNVSNPKIKAWGPTVTGLAVVPVLPYLFDHPVETATHAAFKWIEERVREAKPQAEKEIKDWKEKKDL